MHRTNPIVFQTTRRFSKPKEERKKMYRARKVSTSFFRSLKSERETEMKSWKKKEEKRGTGNRHRFGRIFETIRVRQAKTRSTFFLLSATWTERAITLNSNFHVPFALLSASPLRGEKGGKSGAGIHTLAKIRILFPPRVYFLRKTIRENFYRDCFHDCLGLSLFPPRQIVSS